MSENNTPSNTLYKVLSILMILSAFIIGYIAYPHLPEQMPTHWNAAGEIDGYSSTLKGAFMMPLLMLGVYVLLYIVPKIDPKKSNYSKMSKVYWLFAFVLTLFFTVIYLGTLGTALGYLEGTPKIILLAVGALFIVLGNYMGKIKYNYTFGIKTPWTLASEEVWYKTHRFAGPFWMIGGLIMIVSSFLPSDITSYLFIGVVFLLVAVSFGYSYVLYRKLMN